MISCSHEGCSWQPVAPSEDVARQQLARHVVEAHAEPVEVEIPDGKVEVKLEDDGEWVTLTPEEAKQLHEEAHGD